MMNKLTWMVLAVLLLLAAGCQGVPTWAPPTASPPPTVDVNATVDAAVQATLTAAAQTVAAPTPQATSTPTRAAPPPTHTPTPTPEPPTATPTSRLPTPTPTRRPPTLTPTAEPEPIRIQFAPGTTSATVTGRLGQHGSVLYVLRASAGQMMEVVVSAPGDGVGLSIWGEDGIPLKRYVDETPEWRGQLPATQDYFIHLISIQETSYALTVTIEPLPTEPTRIQFAPGTTSATLTGRVVQGDIDRYVLRAVAEQTMEVVITAPGPDVVLDLWGADGTMLQHHTAGQRQWAGRLPATQDYFINVVSVGQATSYTLMVRIEPLATTPTRIQFEPGKTWATVSGNLAANSSRLYVLRALGGQTMDVGVMSPGNNVGLSIWGADGEFLKWHGDGIPGWRGQLPATQDYYLEVITVEASSYALTVEIPPL